MLRKVNRNHVIFKHIKGFTLVEALVGLIMFEAALAGLLPLIMISRTFSLQSDSRIGAIAVAQQVMDSLRQIDVACLPSSGTEVTNLPDKTVPCKVASTGDSIASLPYKGKTYSATVTYCDVGDYCDTDTRQVHVYVYQDGNTSANPVRVCSPNGRPDQSQCPIYQLTSIFTRLQ